MLAWGLSALLLDAALLLDGFFFATALGAASFLGRPGRRFISAGFAAAAFAEGFAGILPFLFCSGSASAHSSGASWGLVFPLDGCSILHPLQYLHISKCISKHPTLLLAVWENMRSACASAM